jgi:UDP:flavonoid glycosyltransferase YjiC (YdhE family)
MRMLAQREINPTTGHVENFVEIAASKKGLHDPDWLCISTFKKIFGFTPKKGEVYEVTGEVVGDRA